MAVVLSLDNFDPEGFSAVAEGFGERDFAYVVTPNIDHVIRLHEDAEFRSLYAGASYVLLDSRVLAYLLRLRSGLRPRVCTGSDLTAKLFMSVIRPDDVVVLIGATESQADELRRRFRLGRLRHFNPPMGFIRDPAAVEECLQFVERQSPLRFCLIAVGTPQGEMLAHQLKLRGRTRGMTFCIGASINFLTGVERRAPLWMRRFALEWLYRLLRNPRRLANRYLVRGPRIFRLLAATQVVVRGDRR